MVSILASPLLTAVVVIFGSIRSSVLYGYPGRAYTSVHRCVYMKAAVVLSMWASDSLSLCFSSVHQPVSGNFP